MPGMLKSTSAISTEWDEIASTASSALVASINSHSGRIRRDARHHHAGELAVVHNEYFVLHLAGLANFQCQRFEQGRI
jgi:hypothetical protein